MNGLLLLDFLKRGIDITEVHPKMEAWKQELQRKGYLTKDGDLSITGNLILTSINTGLSFPVMKKIVHQGMDEAFEEWWKTYPSTDIFEYKGKKFAGTRGFKVKKAECLIKFRKILEEGEFRYDDMIRALEYEILLKKEASIREGENKMKYMQNSLTYLNQRTFENFIEISKTVKVEIKSSTNNIDI
jgi:hypothetical protein